MKLDCKHIWRELSNYLEGDISDEVRREIEAHVAQCRHCAALLDSTHNILVLVADERRMELPVGFNTRLRQRLEKEMAISGPQ
ncbi:MAG TPA: anti-sigma factor [Candidatus Acidoferrum sp.]|nr:anti-sigma factor [Candidatus Acidoferrum sp.]